MQTTPQNTFDMTHYPVRTVRAQEAVFAYRQAGETAPGKPTIVLLHGIGSTSGSWSPQLARLGGLGHLVAWDAPGYGGSSQLAPDQPVPADYAAALGKFCDALSVPRMILIGHSLGALMAVSFARQNPERVLGLILAAPATGYAQRDEETRNAVFDRIATMNKLGPKGLAQERAAKLLAANAGPEKIGLVTQNMALLTPAGYTQAIHMLAGAHLLDDVAHIPGPVDVFCGAEDIVTPPERVRAVADAAPQGHYQEIPGAGHSLYIDQPDAFAALVEPTIIQRSGGTS